MNTELPLKPNLPILVVGDIILDHYYFGDVDRISPESPVPIVELKDEKFVLGGAGNVARNLAALGSQVFLIGCIGKDQSGKSLKSLVKKAGIEGNFIIETPDRPTTLKTRVISGGQQMLRLDKEVKTDVDNKVLNTLKKFLKGNPSKIQLLILSDYSKGFLSQDVLDFLIKWSHQNKIPVVVDPKGDDYRKYKGVDWITPNRKEAYAASRLTSTQPVDEIAKDLSSHTRCQGILITLGADGMFVQQKKSNKWVGEIIPTQAQEVFDVTGAGDTVIAIFGYGLASGLEPLEAAKLANAGAGIVVGKSGAATVNLQELGTAFSL